MATPITLFQNFDKWLNFNEITFDLWGSKFHFESHRYDCVKSHQLRFK